MAVIAMFNLLTMLLALILALAPAPAQADSKSTDADKDALMAVQKSIIEHMRKGEPGQAEEESRQGIAKAEKSGNSRIAASFYSLLGNALRVRGNYEEAVKAWRKAIDIERKLPEPDHFVIAMDFNNIGDMYRSIGQNEKALAALLEGRKIIGENGLGSDALLHNLGMVYVRLNRNAEAEEAFKKSIAISSSGPSEGRSTTIESMYSLALLYTKEQRSDDCLKMLAEAIPLAEKDLPQSDPRIKTMREMRIAVAAGRLQKTLWKEIMNAGEAAVKEKKFPEAISSFEKALKIAEEAAPGTIGEGNSLMALGTAHVVSGNASAGVESLSKALPIYLQNYGADREEFVTVRKMLEMAKGLQERSRSEVSGGTGSGVQAGSASGVQALGGGSAGSLQESVWLSAMTDGKAAAEKGDFSGAKKSFELAVKQAESFRAQDPRLAVSLSNLAAMCVKTRNFATAATLFERALPLTEKFYGKDSTEVAGIVEGLAVCRLEARDFARALPLVKRVVEIKEPLLGATNQDVITAKKLYAGLVRITGAAAVPTSKVVGAKAATGIRSKNGAGPGAKAGAKSGAGAKGAAAGKK